MQLLNREKCPAIEMIKILIGMFSSRILGVVYKM